MSTIRITGLPALANTPATDDALVLEDISAGETRQIEYGTLLASAAQGVAGAATTPLMSPATTRQAVLSWVRDSLGKFPGITPPSLNLFCGDATDDTAPAGTFARSTTGTRLGAAGVIETVAAGGLRREWGTTGNLLGWSIEGSRSNLFTYSEQLDNTSWTKTRLTVSADTTTAPDGAATADKLVLDSTGATTHYTYKSCSFTSGTPYTVSLYAKAGELSQCVLTLPSAGFSSVQDVLFDLATGTATIRGGTPSVSMHPAGGGFYRCCLTATATATATNIFAFYLAKNNTTSSVNGDGSSGLYVWGAQLESAPFASSYIPTTSAAVARSADVWTVSLATSWFSSVAGTAFVAARTPSGAPSSGVVQVLAQYDDGTASNRIRIVRDSSRILYAVVTTAGTDVATVNLSAVADSTAFRVAFSWSSSGFSASLNGADCVTATTATIPTGLTTHRIGSDSSGSNQWGGQVLQDVYFPIALSDADKIAITL